MPTQMELMTEAYNRGILPEEKIPLYEEAVRRGLVEETPTTKRPSGAGGSFEKSTRQKIGEVVSPYYRPGLEMGGLTAGSIVGTGAYPLVGTVAGGGIGYSIGVNIADRLDEVFDMTQESTMAESSKKALTDVIAGLQYELGGQSLGAAAVGTGKMLKKLWDMLPTISDRGILRKVRELLKPIKRVEDELQTQFPGKEGLGTVVSAVGKTQAQLEAGAAKAVTEAKGAASLKDLQQDVGRAIKGTLTEGKRLAKKKVKELYAKIPKGIKLDATSLLTTLKSVKADFKKIGGGPDTYPSSIIKQIATATKTTKERVPAGFVKMAAKAEKGKKVTFDNLQDWRSQVGQELRDIYASPTPNLKLARRLEMLKGGIDDTMDNMLKVGGKHPEAVKAYREAKAYFVKDYLPAWRSGTVAEVLRSGKQAMGGKIPYGDIPSRFFRSGKMDAADDLVRAVGKTEANTHIRDYAVQDLLAKAGVPESGKLGVTQAQKWLTANKSILNKYGLTEYFEQIVQRRVVAERAVSRLVEYNKTTASVILGSDIDKIIKVKFSGKGGKESAKTMADLLKTEGIEGNKSAIAGLQNSFKDFFLKEAELSGINMLENPLRLIPKVKKFFETYKPAMKVLYKDSPGKIRAMSDYHNLLGKIADESGAAIGMDTVRSITRNLAQLYAISKGKGFFFGVIRNLWSAVMGAPGRYAQQRMDRFLIEAVYNPEVANTIMKAAKQGATLPIREEINHHMIKLGLYAVRGQVGDRRKQPR